MGQHADIDHTGLTGVGTTVTEIVDLPTAETDDTLVLAPDGAGGVEFRAEAGGGGALTQAYVGYNTIGGTWVAMTQSRILAKKVTIATACLITDIEAYIRENTNDASSAAGVGLYDDSGGSPNNLIQEGYRGAPILMDDTSGAGGNQTGRWWGLPIGRWVDPGDYWLAFFCTVQQSAAIEIAKDGSGSDKYHGTGGSFLGDWGFQATTTTTDTYSIRANTIR